MVYITKRSMKSVIKKIIETPTFFNKLPVSNLIDNTRIVECMEFLNTSKLIPDDVDFNVLSYEPTGRIPHNVYLLDKGVSFSYGYTVTHSSSVYGINSFPCFNHQLSTELINAPKHLIKKASYCLPTLISNNDLKNHSINDIEKNIGRESTYEVKRLVRHLLTLDRLKHLVSLIEGKSSMVLLQEGKVKKLIDVTDLDSLLNKDFHSNLLIPNVDNFTNAHLTVFKNCILLLEKYELSNLELITRCKGLNYVKLYGYFEWDDSIIDH